MRKSTTSAKIVSSAVRFPRRKTRQDGAAFLVSAKKLTCAHPKEARHGTAGDKSAFHRDRRADKDLHPAGETGAWRHHAPVAAGNTRGAGAQGRILPHWARGTRRADWAERRGQEHLGQADDGHPDADKRQLHGGWAHAVGGAEGTCAQPRRGVRAANAALVGRADSRFVRPPARHLQH